MSKENKETVEIYKKVSHKYIESSKVHDDLDPEKAKRKKKKLEDLIERSLSSLPKGAKVFEIGAGDGANSEFIKSLGYDVTASDTSEAFINAIKNRDLRTIEFNALDDDFPEKYFAIFCWRVFVHFTKEDALKIIQKVYDALYENGIFIFNAINRETKDRDSEWVDFDGEYHLGVERYYSYYRKEELDEIIGKTDFKIEDFHTEGGENNNKWLVYVLKK